MKFVLVTLSCLALRLRLFRLIVAELIVSENLEASMLNANVINTLSGLLLLTSLLVIETKKPRQSAMLYSFQSLILVMIFLALAMLMDAPQLYLWAASAFVTKAILVPLILYRGLVQSGRDHHFAQHRQYAGLDHSGGGCRGRFIHGCKPDRTQVGGEFIPALAISVAHFFFGQLCIVTQRNIFKQILGFCLMENGSHLTLALLAYPRAGTG